MSTTINKLYGGNGEQYDIQGGGSADVLEPVPQNHNLLNPALFVQQDMCPDYRIGKDGETYVYNPGYTTNEKIPFYVNDLYGKLYFRLSHEAEVPRESVIVMFYDANKTYISYVGHYMDSISFSIQVPNGAMYFRLHIGTRATGFDNDDFCISTEELSEFAQYTEADKLKRIYVPDIPKDNLGNAYQYNKIYGKKMIVMGDSVVGHSSIPYVNGKGNGYGDLVARITGAQVYCGAIAGTSCCKRGLDTWDAMSFCNIADSIVSGDWTDFMAAARGLGRDGDIDTGEVLSTTDFSKVDMLVLAYGYNDGTAVDNPNDKYDTSTMGGAYRHSIETLLGAYPNLRIFLCSLTYNRRFNTESFHKQKCEVIKQICDDYYLTFIDNTKIGINHLNESQYFYDGDFVHLMDNGRQLVAQNIVNHLY